MERRRLNHLLPYKYFMFLHEDTVPVIKVNKKAAW